MRNLDFNMISMSCIFILTGCANTVLPVTKGQLQGTSSATTKITTVQPAVKVTRAWTNKTYKIDPIPQEKAPASLKRKALSNGLKFIWPVKGKILSSFGDIKNNVKNKGIDIEILFNSPVSAAQNGIVAFVDNNFYGWGKTLIIDHKDGLQSVYCGLSNIEIRAGDAVKQGEEIARIFATRDNPQSIHFEIRRGHVPENPLIYLS